MSEIQYTTGEEWRPVCDWEGIYEVSNAGRVRRIKFGQGTKRDRAELKARRNRCGYLAVVLHNYARQSQQFVHRLVAESFIGPRPESREVNHRDGDKANNRAGNLEYVTHSQNVLHAMDLGLRARGSRVYNAKLTEDQVREIRRLYEAGTFSYASLSRRYGVDPSTIYGIVKRRKWPHV